MVQFVYIAALIIVATAYIISIRTMRKRFYKTLDMYKKQLEDTYRLNDRVLEYCLVNIFQDFVKKEDYENANKCKKVLDDLRKINPEIKDRKI